MYKNGEKKNRWGIQGTYEFSRTGCVLIIVADGTLLLPSQIELRASLVSDSFSISSIFFFFTTLTIASTATTTITSPAKPPPNPIAHHFHHLCFFAGGVGTTTEKCPWPCAIHTFGEVKLLKWTVPSSPNVTHLVSFSSLGARMLGKWTETGPPMRLKLSLRLPKALILVAS